MIRRKKTKIDPEKLAAIAARARGYQENRSKGYREKALALFPHVCARCGKEFEGAAMRELTVHHKDHNHDNNPPDGSNWELLCLYCHDDEHQDAVERESTGNTGLGTTEVTLGHNAFEGLKGLLGDKEEE